MKTLFIILISLITFTLQAQDQSEKVQEAPKQETVQLQVSIPMMGTMTLSNVDKQTEKSLEPVIIRKTVKADATATEDMPVLAEVKYTGLKD